MAISNSDAPTTAPEMAKNNIRSRIKGMRVSGGIQIVPRNMTGGLTFFLVTQIGSNFGRATLSQPTVINRATEIAVNIEVMMPSDSVTAKPRIGPEPRK